VSSRRGSGIVRERHSPVPSRRACIRLSHHRVFLLIRDPAGLLEWLAKDRGAVKFHNMSEFSAGQTALEAIVTQWIRYL
jgi:hypothetical protein